MIYLKKRCFVVALLIALWYRSVDGISRPSTMQLNNNQYTNVVVALHESIPEDAALLNTLKETLRNTSAYLYTATRNRAYFKEITILLPSTWSNQASYSAVTSETIANADVIITDPIRGKRSLPQARSYEGCGHQGVHVLLTKDFLTSRDNAPYMGDPAKYLVHAFAQFRWGVFQEYSEEGESEFYISFESGYPEAIRCVRAIRGLVQKNNSNPVTPCYPNIPSNVDASTGLYIDECIWRPYPYRQRVTASIMDHQYVTALETFCDDEASYLTGHNYEAPSKHNRLCGHRSTWDIISNTPDFKGGANSPSSILPNQTTPAIKIVRAHARKKRAIVTIDDSVTVENAASIQLGVERMKKEAMLHGIHLDIDNMQAPVPDDAHRIHISETGHQYTEQNHLTNIVINDRTNTPHNARDSTLVTGRSRDRDYLSRLRRALFGHKMDTKYVLITQREITLFPNAASNGTIGIDETLSEQLTFTFYYDHDPPFIDLRSPSGVIFDTESTFCTFDFDLKIILFHFDFIEVGEWKYKVSEGTSNVQSTIHMCVSSMDANDHHDAIVIRPSVISKQNGRCVLLNVDVTQGSHPVVGLNATARIETPEEVSVTVQLMDNGAGMDVTKGDGIYTRVYCRLASSGVHHVTFVVTGTDKQVYRKEMDIEADSHGDQNPVFKNMVFKRSLSGVVERQTYGGSIHIGNDVLPGYDVIAPNRVTDLKSKLPLEYRNTVILEWTAPGDNLDHGTASKYELFAGYDISDVRLFLNFTRTGVYTGRGHVSNEIFDVTKQDLATELLLWTPKYRSKTLAFCIRAKDAMDNTSECSNVASALHPLNGVKRK